MAKAAEKIEPNRDFVNINALEQTNFLVQCPRCKKTTTIQNAKVTMVVPCTAGCGKQFDLVWWRGVTDPKELQDYLDAAKREAPSTSFDFETTGLEVHSKRLVGVSFCREDQPNVAIYVPMYHSVGQNMDPAVVKEICAPFLSEHPTNAHNFVFEYKWAYVHWGVSPVIADDTQVLCWMDDPNRAGRWDPRSVALKEMARELWDLNVTDLKDMIDLKTQDFSVVPVKQAIPYGCQDSDLTTRLKRHFGPKIKADQKNIHRLEHDIIPDVARMEMRGIKLNVRVLADGATKLDKEIADMERDIFSEMGFQLTEDPMTGDWLRPFDLGSNERVAEQLFLEMGIPYEKRNVGKKKSKKFPNGVPSVSSDALADLAGQFPIIDKLLSYREATHMLINFVRALPSYVDPVTGYIHGSFNQTGTPTGRFAHYNPNLAQQPKNRD